MILEKQSQALIYETGSAKDSIGMSLDLDSAQVLMQMLSKNLYSDPIGSTVRECASNALDSHRRAGTTDPIIVSLQQAPGTSNYEFSVEDFGIGLDADDVEKIISKYGKSTKRDSNTELGMMGLGFKAPLAYASSFYFVCRKNGVERKYMMYEGEDTNTIDLLYEKPTSERNGVKVIIPVKYSDQYNFSRKIKEQLAYFQNVYFKVDGIGNDFSIYRGENYQLSDLCNTTTMHICLDDVYYPIDWEKLEIGGKSKAIDIPIALRFSLTDGIFPTPNREAIRYTVEAKEKIKQKIATVADELVTNYNNTINDNCTFDDVVSWYTTRIIQIKDPRADEDDKTQWIDITPIVGFSKHTIKKPIMKDIHLLDLETLVKRREYILNEYEKRFELTKSWNKIQFRTMSGWAKAFSIGGGYSRSISQETVYIYGDIIGERKKRFVKEHYTRNCMFVKKVKDFKLLTHVTDMNNKKVISEHDYSTYYALLDLYRYPKNQWRQVIQEFQKIRDFYVSNFIDFDSITIPEAWIAKDKASRATVKTSNGGINIKENKNKGDIAGKIPLKMERWSADFNCTFTNHIWKGDSLHKTGKLVIYGKAEDRKLLDKWYVLVNNKYAQIAMLSDKEIKTVESYGLHNWMSIHEFIKGKNKVYRRTVTMLAIRRLKDIYQSIFNKKMETCFIRGMYNDVDALKDYYYKYESNNPRHVYPTHEELDADIAAGNVDTTIIHVYHRLNQLLTKYSWIKVILDDYSYYRKSTYELMMKELCRYNHIHMESNQYKLTDGWQHVDGLGQLRLFVE